MLGLLVGEAGFLGESRLLRLALALGVEQLVRLGSLLLAVTHPDRAYSQRNAESRPVIQAGRRPRSGSLVAVGYERR